MPRFDGTGPWGMSPGFGRGMGPCGLGLRRGLRRVWTKQDEKAALEEEREILKEELKTTEEDLKSLKD